MKLKLLAALAAATILTAPAEAALLRYDLAGTVPGKLTASFTIDTSRAPSIVLPTGLRYNGVAISYTLPGSSAVITENAPFDGVTFQVLSNQGGFFAGFLDGAPNFNNRVQVFGPQLFTGATAAPQFLTGTFDLSDISRSRTTDPLQVNYRLTVTDITNTAAVPEPATWAMMIGGFGLVGGALRRRATALRLAA